MNNNNNPTPQNEVQWDRDFDPSVDTEQTLLFDYCSLYSDHSLETELTLNRGSDGRLYFNAYSGSMYVPGMVERATETRASYLATDECLKELLDLVKHHDLENWRRDEFLAMCGGKRTFVKYYLEESGKTIGVNNDFKPTKRESCNVFQEIKSVMEKHIRQAKRVL